MADDDIKADADYEEYLGDGRRRVFEGHPAYCPLQEVHEPHEFAYKHLVMGESWNGRYACNGWPTSFAQREGR